MTPAQWAQVKEFYSLATEKPRHEREAFLNDACSDPWLQEEVRRLLKAEDTPTLESPVTHLFARQSMPPAIGHYRIVRLVGEGGMGAVYEAEQDHPRRRVAIKAIRPGLGSTALLRRFEDETQALGLLQHPGIAQIYDAGVADWGCGRQPYFAMEFIEGTTLIDYAHHHRLHLPQRLDLFTKICDAVQHAHQRGIIHRDLKPGNILVDKTGQPKIVDFGVARVTDAEAMASRHTDYGQILGTLAYMSPEQVLADPLKLDTRSDVYALGVILYELLAGRLPYQIGDQLHKAVQTICEADPERLSSIDRIYRGDIETIVGKALEKDKTRRYSSAAELAADIQRYLKDEPIVARRASAVYQLRKFARRHRALVTSVVVALIMLIAGLIASTWEAARALRAEQEAWQQRDAAAAARRSDQKERDRAVSAEQLAEAERNLAEAERNRVVIEKQHADTESAAAKAISDFLQNDLLGRASAYVQAQSGGKPDPDLKVRTALDRAASRITGRFQGQPLVEAAIRHTIGRTYSDLGVFPAARQQLERALDLRRRTLGEHHQDTLLTAYSLGAVYRAEGRYREAEPLLIQVLEEWRRALGPHHPNTLSAIDTMAVLYRSTGEYAKAESLLTQALELTRQIRGESHRDTLRCMDVLANLYSKEGKYTLAESLYRKLFDTDRRVLGEEHPDTLAAMNGTALVWLRMGRYAESEQLFAKALELRRRILGPDSYYSMDSITGLALAYQSEGKFAEAESLLKQSIDICRRTLGEENTDTLTVMSNLAHLYRSEDKYSLAEPLFLQVLAKQRRLIGEENPNTLSTGSNLATLYYLEGRYAEAEPLEIRVVEARRRVLGPEHPNTLFSMESLALLYMAENQPDRAQPILQQVVNVRRRVYGDDHSLTFSSMLNLAKAYRLQREFGPAEQLLLQAVASLRQLHGDEHPDTLMAATSLAILYQEEGKYPEAEPLLSKMLPLDRRVLGAAAATTLSCATSLAKVHLAQHQYGEAEALLRDALPPSEKNGRPTWEPFERWSLLGLSLMEQARFADAEPFLIGGYRGLMERKSLVPVPVSFREAGDRIVHLYERWGKPDQAAEWRRKVEAEEPPRPNGQSAAQK